MQIKLPNTLTENDLIEFDLFTKMDKTVADTLVILQNLEASSALINFILRQNEWRGYQYSNGTLIGYGTTEQLNGIGLTEKKSYNFWIDKFKATERRFKAKIGFDSNVMFTQGQYDAMLSLFYHTGEVFSIGTADRKFNVKDYFDNKQWEYYATALVLSGYQRNIRQGEAKIMMLGDYGRTKDRSIIKAEGIQRIRQLYPSRFDSNLAKEQAEYVYYAELQRFLPKMSQTRMRRIVALYKENTG